MRRTKVYKPGHQNCWGGGKHRTKSVFHLACHLKLKSDSCCLPLDGQLKYNAEVLSKLSAFIHLSYLQDRRNMSEDG